MSKRLVDGLSRRERQIMDVIYQRGEATAAEIQSALPEPPGNSAVRALLSLLKQKGMVRHRKEGRARRTVLGRVVKTFFENSVENVVAALIDMSAQNISEDELVRLEKMIQQRREGGRSK